ncbi:hypothetical protein GBAR_LOCUS12807 [Geodia barretti]|uniref:Uncharacterized protein n=1 Tax=Geodia barretti TaxID=519541 RepID=A0AA35S483_GEOBA|nr:hypothetical protein GBAR_LOCUS12807 [Geodia barretti]
MVRTFLVNTFGRLFSSALVGDQSRSGQDPEELLAPAKEPTECTLKLCRHPRAYKWVQWEYCNKWFHCVCGGVKPTQAKLNSYRFKCMFC